MPFPANTNCRRRPAVGRAKLRDGDDRNRPVRPQRHPATGTCRTVRPRQGAAHLRTAWRNDCAGPHQLSVRVPHGTGSRSSGSTPPWKRAARSMGYGPMAAMWRVTLPLLRPAIAGGALLAALYALSDFGGVALMRYETFHRSHLYAVRIVGRSRYCGRAVARPRGPCCDALDTRWAKPQTRPLPSQRRGRPEIATTRRPSAGGAGRQPFSWRCRSSPGSPPR